MTLRIKKAIVRAANYGMNIVELAIWFCEHKSDVTAKEYFSFCDWIKNNENFYYWLRSRLNVNYR